MPQQLARMLGKGAGGGGGGSMAGGGTDKASAAATGLGVGAKVEERQVDIAGGRDTASLPIEFRDALEGYFNAVEKNR
jgi:hypothetical protein